MLSMTKRATRSPAIHTASTRNGSRCCEWRKYALLRMALTIAPGGSTWFSTAYSPGISCGAAGPPEEGIPKIIRSPNVGTNAQALQTASIVEHHSADAAAPAAMTPHNSRNGLRSPPDHGIDEHREQQAGADCYRKHARQPAAQCELRSVCVEGEHADEAGHRRGQGQIERIRPSGSLLGRGWTSVTGSPRPERSTRGAPRPRARERPTFRPRSRPAAGHASGADEGTVDRLPGDGSPSAGRRGVAMERDAAIAA